MKHNPLIKRHFDWSRIGAVTAAIGLMASLLYPLHARAETTLLYSGSAVSGDVAATLQINGLSVSSDETTIPVTLQVDDGLLSMSTTTGLTFSTAPTGSTLAFRGSQNDVNAALATLRYRSIIPGEKTLTATILGQNEVYYANNGHMYEVVNHNSNISWSDAKTFAESRTKNGAAGYLATIATASEAEYLANKLPADGWIAATDAATEGEWHWASGPETDSQFWLGAADGAVIGDNFANWAAGEPNDSNTNEDCAIFYKDGSGWNDMACSGDFMDHTVIEYGSDGDLPSAPSSASIGITINQPVSNVVSITACEDLAAISANPNAGRFDTISLANAIDCTGVPITPLYAANDPEFNMLGFSGEFDGNGFAISNLSLDQPDTDSVGLFAATRGASIHDVSLNGTLNGHICSGALVGTAENTSIQNVSSTVGVNGWQDTGGLVGCLSTSDAQSHPFTGNSVSGSITNITDTIGGLVGDAQFGGSSSVALSSNEFSGNLSTSLQTAGSLIGSLKASGDASVTITDITVVLTNLAGIRAVGGIAGTALAESTANITVTAVNTSGSVVAGENAGAIFGEAYNYTSSPTGLLIQNVQISADISTLTEGRVGGLVGYAERIALQDVSASGAVTSQTNDAGGLVGALFDGTITNATASGTVGTSGSSAGGLAGSFVGGLIAASYATSSVSSGENNAGGLVGYHEGTLQNTYASGASTGSDAIGGLIGYCVGTVQDSYATGAVSGSSNLGGLIGAIDTCTSQNSFWDTQTTTQEASASSETGKTTAELKNRDTLLNTVTTGLTTAWDFETTWEMNEAVNNGYACLRWQSTTCVMPAWVDEDADGVPSVVEDAAPNSGDANDDGLPDSEQVNVSSFVNEVSTTYTAVELDPVCTFTDIGVTPENGIPNGDGGFDYSSGLIDFTAECGTPGYATDVTVITYGVDPNGLTLRKYNPNTDSYFTIDSALFEAVTINGLPAVSATYQVTDGGVLDIDGSANGVIVDPVGFAKTAVTPSPTPKPKKEKKDKKDKDHKDDKDKAKNDKDDKSGKSKK